MKQNFIKAFNEANETTTYKGIGGFDAVFRRKLNVFRKKEDGSVIIFGLYMLVCMMIISGLALDTMQSEYLRTKVQATTDRALLASASMKQTVAAQDIMDDYFAKAGMAGMAPTATVDAGLNYRKVSAKYDEDNIPSVDTIFMSKSFRQLLQQKDAGGIDKLMANASGTAIDGVDKVEISLVLDVSGSMTWRSASGNIKLSELKDAAEEFIDTLMLDQPEDDTYSISVVPYAMQVNAGSDLLSKLNVSSEHDYSHCVDFSDNDFKSAAISTGNQLQRTGHFQPWDSNYDRKDDDIYWGHRVCPNTTARAILPLSGDINTLKTYVNALVATGNTSTDIGMKWGAALLDPSTRTAVTSLILDGDITSKFSGRPYAYTEENVLKVIVVMSDGQNTYQYTLDDEVSGGYVDPADNLSNVWKYTNTYTRWGRTYTETRYAIYNPNRWGNKYFYTDRNSTRGNWYSSPPANGDRLSYVKLYDHATVRYVANYMMYPAGYNYNEWRYNKYSTVDADEKDDRMDDICTAAKNKDVLIFAIGFEVSDSNATKLSNCATSAGHFFRVEGVEISEAFSSIAAQLHRLRLAK